MPGGLPNTLADILTINGIPADAAKLIDAAVADFLSGVAKAVPTSRTLTQEDNGATLDCAASVVLTIPPGLSNFGCAVRPAGVQIACGSGVTINGAGSTITTTARVGAINPSGTANAYDVVGV